MKIAVFSDVHGNLSALKAVLERIRERNADVTVFLGDIFQRGNEEFECLELLMNSGIVCLKGNCERIMDYENRTMNVKTVEDTICRRLERIRVIRALDVIVRARGSVIKIIRYKK